MPLQRPKSTVALAVVPVLKGLAALVAIGLVLWVAAVLLSRGDGVESQLGEDVFRAGQAEALARETEQGPLLFPGLVGTAGTRAIGVHHAGDDPTSGWSVFSIERNGCVLEVDRTALDLVDPCTGQSFPADGAGLAPVPWSVDDDGDLIIDLRAGPSPVATSVAATAPLPSTAVATTSSG
jgi:hypothetical protein